MQIREKDNASMMYVYAGEFTMGIPQERLDELLKLKEERSGEYWSVGLFSSAVPDHIVYLDAYWIDKYEVTNAQFAAFLNAEGNQVFDDKYWYDAKTNEYRVTWTGSSWSADEEYANHPVTSVGWHAARSYCEWVGGRLPTEAEWEKAARGTDGRDYVWGNEPPPDGKNANMYTEWPRSTAPVGSFPQDTSPFGVMDMTGNVGEWVNDWFYGDYYKESPAKNPPGYQQEYSRYSVKVIRGGEYLSFFEVNGLVYQRFANYPKMTVCSWGFRCAMDAE
jgi:iron(II)-dependent oxidoreductase